MSSLLDEMPGLLGAQRPRVYSCPPYVSTMGEKAIALAEMVGLYLDEWQQLSVTDMLGLRADKKWAAFEDAVIVSRQNGKGDVIATRELAGLFLIPDDKLIIHSAHQFDTSLEAFDRLVSYILGTPELRKRIRGYRGPDLDPRGISRSHGTEGITLKNGKRIRFRTRTKGGGRGFTCDCLILDEAMIIPDAMLTALLPTLSARPNPQIIYAGSAVDQEIHEYGVVLARIRERGHAGGDPSLAYSEWSAADTLEQVTPEVANDPASWALANPALGIRITAEKVANERRAFASNVKGFAVERLGVGDWPSTDPTASKVIDLAKWLACKDPDSHRDGPVSIAFDVTPARTMSCIAVAGRRADGLLHIEVIEHKSGTSWVVDRIAELNKSKRPVAIVCDAGSPAKSLLPDFESIGLPVIAVNGSEHAQACGIFYDAVMDTQTLRHLGTPELDGAVSGAATRPLGEAWAWSRRDSDVDISPLVACTLALWGIATQLKTPEVWDIAEMVKELQAERDAVTKAEAPKSKPAPIKRVRLEDL